MPSQMISESSLDKPEALGLRFDSHQHAVDFA